MLTTAALLLLAVFACSLLSTATPAAFAAVYVLPVMLFGLELGVYGGTAAGLLASGLLLAAWLYKADLAALDLCGSTVALISAGWLAGHFSSRMRSTHRRHERLLASGFRLARLESVDELPTTLAEELQQTLDLSGVRVHLLGAPEIVIGDSADESIQIPISTRGVNFGNLSVTASAGRAFSEEDRTVAVKLAQQAAIAADNQRLLASEREKAALHTELEHTRERLASHMRNLGEILDSEETGRREIARQLHEEAAQAIAGVLLGLKVLERDVDHDLNRVQLEQVRAITRETLADLRQLAVSVRPPSLDELGLPAALEGVIGRETARRGEPISFSCVNCGRDIPVEAQTCAYHVLEDAIQTLDGPIAVQMEIDQDRLRIRIDGQGSLPVPGEPEPTGRLLVSRARLELLDGALEMTAGVTGRIGILAEIPLAGSRAYRVSDPPTYLSAV